MEQVIHAVRIVETDDGYRIEIQGDKQRLKEIFERGPFGMGLPPFAFRRFLRGSWGERGCGPWGFMHGPWGGKRGRRHHGWHGPWEQWSGGEEEEGEPGAQEF